MKIKNLLSKLIKAGYTNYTEQKLETMENDELEALD